MEPEEIRDRIRHLLAGQHLAVLGTSDHGHPYTSLVVYSEFPSLNHIVFYTLRNRIKYRNLKNDSRVSLYIDSRDRWQKDPSTVEGLSITGVAWEVKRSEEFEEAKQVYLQKNPHMDFIASDGDASLFRINVETYKYVVNFEDSYELNI